MKILKVFPRETRATPKDELSYIGDPPLLFPPEADKINISVTFEWDLKEAGRLEKQWRVIAPVEIGGPATGMSGGDFIPGQYLKHGYVITSRGCRNRCWFCSVWKREGDIKELPITEGNILLDDNLLSCNSNHINKVFEMLNKQKNRPDFRGGIEAALLKEWHVKEFVKLNPIQIWYAYNTSDDREPLFEAGILLKKYGFKINHPLRCYNLIGFPKDTFEKAEKRLYETIEAGFMPMAMLYRNNTGNTEHKWRKFQRLWARPVVIGAKIKAAIK